MIDDDDVTLSHRLPQSLLRQLSTPEQEEVKEEIRAAINQTINEILGKRHCVGDQTMFLEKSLVQNEP